MTVLKMTCPKCLLCFLLSLYTTITCITSNPRVNTTTALIKGSEIKYHEKKVYQFMGIPFAQPPVEKLRFKKTVPLHGWSGELNASHTPPACSQYFPFDYDVIDKLPWKSEDCLYLNIWVPGDACPKNRKAVMFWLFAGSFTTGSNRLPIYNGTVLAAKGDVIVVTPNYRLGIFGFLSTYSEKAPGNMGLYDVLEALKWVNSNIEAFGGDKNRITICGNTAGSLISGLFTISPLTKGLFRSVIMESGAENVVRGSDKQYNLRVGQRVATVVHCASELKTLQNNTEEVVECLESKTAEELVKAVYFTIKTSLISFLPNFGDEILPENPYEAYENGNVHVDSVLIGNCRNEGTFQLVSENPKVFGPYGEKDPVINKTYGEQFLNEVLRKDNINSTGQRLIDDYYLSSVSDTDYYGIRHQVARAIGDVTIFCNDYYFALLYSNRVKVYFYYFIHQDPTTKFANWTGVTLFSEILYVFGIPIIDPEYPREDAKLSEKILHIWTDYVKDGVPSEDWKTFNGSEPSPYVKILRAEGDFDDNIYQRFNNCDFLRDYI